MVAALRELGVSEVWPGNTHSTLAWKSIYGKAIK